MRARAGISAVSTRVTVWARVPGAHSAADQRKLLGYVSNERVTTATIMPPLPLVCGHRTDLRTHVACFSPVGPIRRDHGAASATTVAPTLFGTWHLLPEQSGTSFAGRTCRRRTRVLAAPPAKADRLGLRQSGSSRPHRDHRPFERDGSSPNLVLASRMCQLQRRRRIRPEGQNHAR